VTRPDRHTPAHPAVATILLAGATGARSMLGVAAVARALDETDIDAAHQPTRALAESRVRRATTALSAMEIVADKLPGIADRVDLAPIVGRALGGAIIGAAVADLAGRDRRTAALIGAASAMIAAHLSFRLRRRLAAAVPAVAAGTIEDVVVIGVAAAGVAAMRQGR
jgi:hypothetical protein